MPAAKASWGGGGWGSWHTATGACPQGDGSHTLDQAVALNERETEYRQAVMHARNKQWLGHEKAPGSAEGATEG